MEDKFTIEFTKSAKKFLESLETKARQKIIYNINKAKGSNNKSLFKKLSGEIWEFRTKYNGICYRLLGFWTKDAKRLTMVLITHGFIKKDDKTPIKEISRAEAIRKRYLKDKEAVE